MDRATAKQGQPRENRAIVDLELDLLRACGVEAAEELASYRQKIDEILERFRRKQHATVPAGTKMSNRDPAAKARALFDYLWLSKPRRHGDGALLTTAIDAQLSPDPHWRLGNCIALTCLYTVLGLREDLDLAVLVSDSHVMSRLTTPAGHYNIEHTDPLGFETDVDLSNFREYAPAVLAAHIYNSRGIGYERRGDWVAAASCYEMAICRRPDYANAYNNLGNTWLRRRQFRRAIADYSIAARLDPHQAEPLCNRALAREHLGDHRNALADYDLALALDPRSDEARAGRERCRAKLKMAADQLVRPAPTPRG